MDSRFEIQLEEDGVSSTGQRWMEKSGLWPAYAPLGAKRLKSCKSYNTIVFESEDPNIGINCHIH